VREQQCLEADDLLSQLSDGGGECIILRAEHLNFLLEIGQPLLLALSTLQCRDSVQILVKQITSRRKRVAHLLRSRKFLRFSSSVIFDLSGF
jgi:hypothetical protein